MYNIKQYTINLHFNSKNEPSRNHYNQGLSWEGGGEQDVFIYGGGDVFIIHIFVHGKSILLQKKLVYNFVV